MSSNKFTDRERHFEEVIARLKRAIKAENDARIAEELGLSGSGFANIKKRSSLPYERLEQICNSRNVSMDWLLTGEGSMWRHDPPADKQMAALMELVAALSPEQRREICSVAEEKKRLNDLERAIAELRAVSTKRR